MKFSFFQFISSLKVEHFEVQQWEGKLCKEHFRASLNHVAENLFSATKMTKSPRLFFQVTSLFILSSLLVVEAEESSGKVEKAKKFAITPSVTVGMMNYKFKVGSEEEKFFGASNNLTLTENLYFGGVGLTFSYRQPFLIFRHGFSLSTSLRKTGTVNEDQDRLFETGSEKTVFVDRGVDLERQDGSISLGVPITRNLSFIAGYTKSKTGYDWNDIERDEDNKNVGFAVKANDFSADGFFGGINYVVWQTNKGLFGKGVLGISAAIAKLDGEIKTHRIHNPGESDLLILGKRETSQNVLSDTLGFKLGVTWREQIFIKNLSYTVSFNYFKYEFDAKNGTFSDDLFSDGGRRHEIVDLDSFDVTERAYSLNLSLRYRFDF